MTPALDLGIISSTKTVQLYYNFRGTLKVTFNYKEI